MTDSPEQQPFVARCKPQPAQHATSAMNRATGHATAAQHPSLKALALLALGRNNARNTHATDPEKPRNNEAFPERGLLRSDQSLATIRTRLLALAEQNGIDAVHVHAQDDDDIAECRGLSDATLRDWMRLRDACPECSRCKPLPRPTTAATTREHRA